MPSVRLIGNYQGGRGVGCVIGLTPRLGVVSVGDDGADALHQAAAAAQTLVVLADTHPELAPLINSDTVKGLRALAAAAGVVKAGGGKKDIASQVGPIAANVVTKLLTGGLF